REALFEYAAMGGLLVVIGPLPSWPDWPSVEGSLEGSRIVFAGFGVILCLPADVQGSSSSPIWELALDRAEESSQPLVAPLGNARPGFISAIGDDIRLPVRGLFFLTVVFALLLGPVNLFFLHRKRRRVWLWWTVPATALLTTSLLTGFALFVEGSQIRVRTRSMTLLDERHDQAFTVGDQGYFSTRSIPQGVSFSQRTEVVPLVEFGIQPFYRTLHLEGGLRLAQGWVSPRIPAHFQIRSPQRRRERLPVRITGGGGVEVTNGLGAAIQQVWFCTLDGSVYWGRDIAPGESQTLTATGRKRPSDFPSAKVWRDYYRDGWHTESFVPNSVDVLRPGTYTAILADSPFVEAGVPRITHSDRFSIVHGISALSPEAEQGTSSAQESRGGGR
ncbi:MAG TPA: hypothetical protein VLV83_14345, partial [Acidobacteriota bacterium]|nr:hypothetical protein [Acidobacteriota bacterium]